MTALLTVVVPLYDVARYLDDCLRSLAGQTYPELDVVLVDDGSTDASADIAAGWARANPRFRLVRQENRGLGAARNTGVDLARGDYLAFLDSDDLLPPYAYEVLVGALEQTGSDFASGNVALLTGRGLRQSPLHRGTHRVTRLGGDLARQPYLVYDRLACNKVFRRSFWERHGLRFPEGVRYEDIPVTVPAYALARAVDVIDLPVYYWRQRDPGGDRSLSQRQTDLRSLVDRFAAVDSASRSLAAIGGQQLKDWYDATALQNDLRMFLDLLPDADDDYRKRFVELASDFLSRVDERVVERLVPRLRVAWRLAGEQVLPGLLAVAANQRDEAPSAIRQGGRRDLRPPALADPHATMPRRMFGQPGGLCSEVHEARWIGGRLQVRGFAYDATQGAARPWSAGHLLWLREHSGRRRFLPLFSGPHRVVQQQSSLVPYGWSGFSAVIDPLRLRDRARWRAGDWSFNVAVLAGGRLRRQPLTVGEARPVLPARWVADGVRVVPWIRGRRLLLRVERPRVWVTAVRFAADELLVEGRAPASPAAAVLRLARVPGVAGRSYPVERAETARLWSARIPLADLVADAALNDRPVLAGEAGAGWRVAFAESGGEAQELPVPAGFAGVRHAVGELELMAWSAEDEVLWLRILLAGPLGSGVRLTDGIFVLTGELPRGPAGWDDFQIVLSWISGTRTEGGPLPDIELPVELAGRRWTARLPLVGAAPLPDSDWQLRYRRNADASPVDLPFDVPARASLPRPVVVGGRRVELVPDGERLTLRLAHW